MATCRPPPRRLVPASTRRPKRRGTREGTRAATTVSNTRMPPSALLRQVAFVVASRPCGCETPSLPVSRAKGRVVHALSRAAKAGHQSPRTGGQPWTEPGGSSAASEPQAAVYLSRSPGASLRPELPVRTCNAAKAMRLSRRCVALSPHGGPSTRSASGSPPRRRSQLGRHKPRNPCLFTSAVLAGPASEPS